MKIYHRRNLALIMKYWEIWNVMANNEMKTKMSNHENEINIMAYENEIMAWNNQIYSNKSNENNNLIIKAQ